MYEVFVIAAGRNRASIDSALNPRALMLSAIAERPGDAVRVAYRKDAGTMADAAFLARTCEHMARMRFEMESARWFTCKPSSLVKLVKEIVAFVDSPGPDVDPHLGAQYAMEVYHDVPHTIIARIAKVHPTTPRRWLRKNLVMNYMHMERLRRFARVTGRPWDDDRIFQFSPSEEVSEPEPEALRTRDRVEENTTHA